MSVIIHGISIFMQHLDSFVVIVIGFLLEVLLQERVGFCLLRSNTAKVQHQDKFYKEVKFTLFDTLWRPPAGLEGGVVARGVGLVDTGTVLDVIGDQDH